MNVDLDLNIDLDLDHDLDRNVGLEVYVGIEYGLDASCHLDRDAGVDIDFDLDRDRDVGLQVDVEVDVDPDVYLDLDRDLEVDVDIDPSLAHLVPTRRHAQEKITYRNMTDPSFRRLVINMDNVCPELDLVRHEVIICFLFLDDIDLVRSAHAQGR